MEDREASVASSIDFYESDRKPDTPPRDTYPQNGASPISSPTKRKAEALVPLQDKKRRIESSPSPSTNLAPCAGLPPAVWQHIFLFCPLEALGQLLQVNRSFHSYLADVRNTPTVKPDSGFPRLLKSESIWASARNMHSTKPPRPLPGFTEIQMWHLISNKNCQFCKRDNTLTPGEKIWQKGPGANGVRIIWPFGIRSCGPCLLQRCQTDSSLLFSTVSVARPGLPYALITSDQHYIPSYTLQAATTPANVEIVKYYYKDHVTEITAELEGALSLGPAAGEEWLKGLESRGKERMKSAENWERWEVKYQWWKDHSEPKRAASVALSSSSNQRQKTTSPARNVTSPVLHAPVPASKYRSVSLVPGEEHRIQFLDKVHPSMSSSTPLTNIAMPQQTTPGPHYVQHRPPTIPPQVFTPQSGANAVAPPPRSERNLHDANEAKANRKLDIERRCQQLDPPISPNVLRHMDSFKAAIQISQPMNDWAWSMLEPRLRSQLAAAQQAENEHTSRIASLTTRAADRRQQDASLKEVKEVLDREWEESQRPIRDKLSLLADDFIDQDWDHGRAVTYENSPKFAVDLLMHVRRRFYAEYNDEVKPAPQPHEENDSGEPDNHKAKLVLENMKWVYDNKLKPLTEQYRKELFLCYGNGCESNTRFYGFEGVIQHFGAKHTNTFSVGNVVVAWREAEWPEETPFHPDPISVKHAFHASGAGGQNGGYGSYYGGYSRAGTITPHMQPHLPQASPGPYSYNAQYSGPFAPPQPQTGYDYSQSYGPNVDSYSSYSSMGPPGYGHVPNNSTYTTSPAMSRPSIAHQPTSQSQIPGVNEHGDVEYRTSLFDKQVSTIIEAAQDFWKQTSGIKDLPNSLRIYVLLQRVISKFQIEFNHEPDLSHFIDALSNHQIHKALKNAPGLSCKSCRGDSLHRSNVYPSRSEERKTYTVLNLFMHFQSHHTGHSHDFGQGHPMPYLDWKEDMIELPSDRFISGLIHAPGMDDDKLLMIATVFPRLFPTPLPRIGVIENNGATSPANSAPKDDTKESAGASGTPGIAAEKSGPSSLASPYTESPRPPKPSEDEYDPQRPALPSQTQQPSRTMHRARNPRTSPLPGHRHGYYGPEPQYYLSRDPLDDDEYSGPRGYVEVAPNTRRIRDAGPPYGEYSGRRPVFRDSDEIYRPSHEEIIYAPREGPYQREYDPHSYHEVRYADDDHPDLRPRRGPPESSPSQSRTAADRFLDELGSSLAANRSAEQDDNTQVAPKPTTTDPDLDDGSRYTPPPPNHSSAGEKPDRGRPTTNPQHAPLAPVPNGSRLDEYATSSRQVPTPESVGGPRRTAPSRRRDRNLDHVPSRYYRYLSVGRDEPHPRGPSVGRSHSRRYERYEEQRRRINEQETPQPHAERDYDPTYSRDQSVDQGPPDDYHPPARHTPRDYIPLQDRAHPYSPPRLRYTGHTDDPRGPHPVYVDEFGQPLEVIRVPRDRRSGRGQYFAQPSRYYPDHEPEQYQYVSYGRPPPQRYDGPTREYVYYEERPPQARRPAFEAESEPPFEAPPPEIKVEGAPPTAEGP